MEIKIANEVEIRSINEKVAVFQNECGRALKWVYMHQNWDGEKISRRIKGLSASTWKQYAEQGYNKNRSLHAFAAFSWVSQVTMTALYMGSKIDQFWVGVDDTSIRAVIYTGVLKRRAFYHLIELLRDELHTLGNEPDPKVDKILEELNTYEDEAFLAPKVLDLDDFKLDYYESIGLMLKQFRENFGVRLDEMAYVLDISVDRYLGYEYPCENTWIPLHLAMRLKLGFHIGDTTGFLTEMRRYRGYHTARKIQQLRETVLFYVFEKIDESKKQMFCHLAREFMLFHLKNLGS